MYFVYIFYSQNYKKTYTGVTKDLKRRIAEHNSGRGHFSKKYKPFILLHLDEFLSSSEAYAKEKFYKTTSGRRAIKKIIDLKSVEN